MKKIFTLVASACFSVMLASAAAPVRGLVFNASAGIEIPGSTDAIFSAPTAITVEAWVNYSDLAGGYILCNESGGPDSGWVLRLEGNKLDFSIGVEGASWVHCTNTVLPDLGTWYHAAGVYQFADGAGTLKLYIDGVEANSVDLTAPMAASARAVVMGEGTAFTPRALRGSLADVRVWSVARSAEEIAGNKDKYLTGNESGLVANWKMDEATGDEIKDVKGVYTLSKPGDDAGVTWFGTPVGIQNATAANVEVLVNGQSLSVVNSNSSAINFTIFTLAGTKVLDGAVKAGATFAKETSLNGVFILKGVAEDGSTIIKKVVLN